MGRADMLAFLLEPARLNEQPGEREFNIQPGEREVAADLDMDAKDRKLLALCRLWCGVGCTAPPAIGRPWWDMPSGTFAKPSKLKPPRSISALECIEIRYLYSRNAMHKHRTA